MLLTNSTFAFIDEIELQDDLSTVVTSFQSLIGKFGMASFMMGNPSQPQIFREDRLWATTWPDAWLRHWSAQNYISIDPVVNQLLVRDEAVRWGTGDAGDDATAKILEEASEFRMK